MHFLNATGMENTIAIPVHSIEWYFWRKVLRMKKYFLKNMDCASCAAKIERNLAKLEEVKFVNVNFANATMTIEAENLQKVKDVIIKLEPEIEITEATQKQQFITADEINENRTTILKAVSALALLVTGLVFEEQLRGTPYWWLEYAIFISAYAISGWKVIHTAFRNIARGRVFDEQFLMTIATLGAFAINEMAEAVAVMLFYVVGEFFQDVAVSRSRRSIKALLEIKPEYANLKSDEGFVKISPEQAKPGDIIMVKPGEKIPLDGLVMEGESLVDTAALTGESVPRRIAEKKEVLAGMINLSGSLIVEVKKTFGESSIAKILDMVENAASKKTKTEKFISTFAGYYTPAVVFGAALLAIIPPLLIPDALFSEWLYRALVVLVISCPCALVISIPLGYFGGVGGAARRGVLVKGSNFLDALTKVKTVVFDKTGTLTKGEFKVSEIVSFNDFTKEQLLDYAAHAETGSNHPIAKSITEAFDLPINHERIGQTQEISGLGIRSSIDGKEVVVGSDRLLHNDRIERPEGEVNGTVAHVSVDRVYAGYLIISDALKDDSAGTIAELKSRNIKTVMLTGDNESATQSFAKSLGIDRYYAGLLPEDKVKHIEGIINENEGGKTVFVGDGINDAPVIARADIGIAMGALGSDVAIETADVVLMTDSPSKVVEAIDIANRTRNIVWQNIIFSLGVKMAFITLGIIGVASMWEAVFGDIGVALIAVFNAGRILKVK